MAETKTKATNASVAEYIASRASALQLEDCHQLITLLSEVTGQPATMWGPSIVGFGRYRYTYDSGHSGEAPLAGFAIRGRDIVIYLLAESGEQEQLLQQLGKHKMGKACLYIKRLADLDTVVLKQLVVNSVAELQRRYG
ncbi:DUF1801 domain-containing protein [Rheinheimera sp. EpRS3]|uniref:DUF1801 domain-containing protein n=1 Tax=Rheinheimera sp. EpRS3 TaxID=1712383 RepID=UPI000747AA7B|nr:DUF1801 domain-containing protein [Rheinheimera sp. EpRS3]KUM52528.1 hypothetical protein AR688_09525 [Rheinheimera sp. EpRS3]